MDSLEDILAKHAPQEPPEIRLIKDFVLKEYNETVEVMARERDVLIILKSAALAGTLRLRLPEIERLIGGTKKIHFRLG